MTLRGEHFELTEAEAVLLYALLDTFVSRGVFAPAALGFSLNGWLPAAFQARHCYFTGASWATKPPSSATGILNVSVGERFNVSVMRWFGSDAASGASLQRLAV